VIIILNGLALASFHVEFIVTSANCLFVACFVSVLAVRLSGTDCSLARYGILIRDQFQIH
jgi:hypothetical protein